MFLMMVCYHEHNYYFGHCPLSFDFSHTISETISVPVARSMVVGEVYASLEHLGDPPLHNLMMETNPVFKTLCLKKPKTMGNVQNNFYRVYENIFLTL
jgi:hypothetical protein